MTDRPVNTRRWLQFRLRTLIAFITICAVACWTFLDGIPRFKEYQRRSQFESIARHLKAGNPYLPLHESLDSFINDSLFDILMRTDAEGHEFTITPYRLKTVMYFVVERYEAPLASYVRPRGKPHLVESMRVSYRLEVFRVAQMPPNYQPRSPEAIKHSNQADNPDARQAPRSWYEEDFAEYAISDRSDDFGLKPELIHLHSIEAKPAHE
jgi:hypothetical protein